MIVLRRRREGRPARKRLPAPQGEARMARETLGPFSTRRRNSWEGPEMTPERYRRLCELFDQAQARPTEQRAAFLDEVGAADPALRAELEGMLADDQKARGEHLLQGPCPVNAKALLPGEQPTVPGAPPADGPAEDGDPLV